MPAAVIGVAASVAGGAAASAVGGGIVGALVGGAVSVGVSYLGHRAFGLDEPGFALPEAASPRVVGRTEMVRQPITPHRIVYGEVRTSGPLVFLHTRPVDGGDSGKLDMLHLVLVLAAHPVTAIGTVWFNDAEVPLDPHGDAVADPWLRDGTVYAHVDTLLGAVDQAAIAELVTQSDGAWTAAHRMRGRAALHVRLRFDATAFPAGVPNVSALVRGRAVHDPRDGGQRWSDNPALCLLDYLTAGFGLGAGLDEIDLDSFIAAATLCDEPVTSLDGTERRYTLNGTVDLGDSPRRILQAMLTSCAGRLSWTAGRWRLTVGAWTAPALVLGGDQVRDSFSFRPRRSRRELINTVRGAFVSPAHRWQPTDYPPVSRALYREQDGGEEVAATLDLPFTTSASMAQRIARIALEQNRKQRQLTLPVNLAGLDIAAGDMVAVDLPRLGLAELPCLVTGWQLTPDLGVDLTLEEDGPAVYAFDPADLIPLETAPAVTLPGNAGVPPAAPGELTASAGGHSIALSWRNPADSDFRHVEVWEAPTAVADPLQGAQKIHEIQGQSLTVTGLPGGTTRHYWERAIDRAGNASAFAGPVSATTTAVEPILLALE